MPKQPFITPLTVWLQTDLYYDRIKQAFTGEAAHEFFNVDYLVQMLDDHKSADFSTVEGRGKLKMMRIWNIYCFLCWYEVFFHMRAFARLRSAMSAGAIVKPQVGRLPDCYILE